eukprot:scaffold70556_cov43-Prasinocladus_malaysianus.AAC.2
MPYSTSASKLCSFCRGSLGVGSDLADMWKRTGKMIRRDLSRDYVVQPVTVDNDVPPGMQTDALLSKFFSYGRAYELNSIIDVVELRSSVDSDGPALPHYDRLAIAKLAMGK